MDNLHQQAVDYIIETLPIQYPFIEQIWIYGSCARGDNSIFSDVDILCVLPKDMFNKKTVMDIRRNYITNYNLPDIDIHFVGEKIYNDSGNICEVYKNDIFIKNVVRDGRIIWEQKATTNLQKMTIME